MARVRWEMLVVFSDAPGGYKDAMPDVEHAHAAHTERDAGSAFVLRLIRAGVPLLLVVLTFSAFWPGLSGAFLTWDDDKLLTENPWFRGFGADNLRWMFTTNLLGQYQPIAWLSYAVDHAIWESKPFGYHFSSLILFTLGVLLFYRLAGTVLCMTATGKRHRGGIGIVLAAGIAAALYAVHPLRVETICWISNRGYVLSALFFLLAIRAYLHYANSRSSGRPGMGFFYLCFLFHGLSLLSRANAVALPFVLLILDAYPLGRLPGSPKAWLVPENRNVLLEKLPLLVLSLMGAGLASWAKADVGTVASVELYPLYSRVAMGVYAITFYLQKTIWPTGLLPLYEKPPQLNPFEFKYLAQGAIVLFLTGVLFVSRRKWPAGWLVWLYTLLILLPVIGIVQIGMQIAADRYTQLPSMGWMLLISGGALRCMPTKRGACASLLAQSVIGVVGLAVVLALVPASRKQSRVWHDSEILWRTTLAGNADSLTALNNLGMILARSGYHEEAQRHWQHALELQPKYGEVHLNIGSSFLERGHLALAIKQDSEQAQRFFAVAIEHFEQAQRLGVDSPLLLSNLGAAWAEKGDLDKALQYLTRAVELGPDDAQSHFNLGILYARLGRLDEAEQEFRVAIRLAPEHEDAQHNLRVLQSMRAQRRTPQV